MQRAKKNLKIIEAQRKAGLFNYEVAKLCGISEPTWTRWMRDELPEERQGEIVALIEKATKG